MKHLLRHGGFLAALLVSIATAAAQTPGPATTPGARPEQRKLGMQAAIELALQNSPVLKSAAEQVQKARGAVNESKAAFVPTLSAEGTLTHLDQGVSAQLAPGQSITIVRQDQKSATLTAAVPIDVSGLLRAATSVAEFQYLIARLDYNRQRNQLVQDVVAAYYNVLRARAALGVAEQALTNAEDRQRIAEAYLKAGSGTRFDVLRAETETANARQAVMAAQNRVALATAALNNLLGLDQNTPLDLEEPPAGADMMPDVDRALEEAYRQRPEILQAEAGIKAAEKGIHLAVRSQLPMVALAWSQQFTPDTGAFGRKQSWAAVAKISLPLFDGGLAAARRQQAEASLDAARWSRRQAMDGIALEVRQAYLSFVDASERLKVAEAAVAQAEEAYRLAQVRYKAGVTLTPGGSPLLEISDAQTALTQALTNRVNARYELEIARNQLLKAMGRYAYAPSAAPGLETPPVGDKK